jgi:regulator of ribonuclease activity A
MNNPQSIHPQVTTDLHDKYPLEFRRCTLAFQQYGQRHIFAGPIRTVVTMEDTKLAQQLFREQGDGAVIVLDGGGSMHSAMLGDINADILAKNNWAGIIINGAIRDSAALSNINIGIKALGTTPIRSEKKGIGAIDVPVAFGHVLFETGQYIYCDEDGIIVSDSPMYL